MRARLGLAVISLQKVDSCLDLVLDLVVKRFSATWNQYKLILSFCWIRASSKLERLLSEKFDSPRLPGSKITSAKSSTNLDRFYRGFTIHLP